MFIPRNYCTNSNTIASQQAINWIASFLSNRTRNSNTRK